MFYRVQAFCDLLDSRKEPFGFSIAPFSSAFSECRIDVFREDMEPPVLDGLVRVRDYGVDGSSHVVSPEKGESPGH